MGRRAFTVTLVLALVAGACRSGSDPDRSGGRAGPASTRPPEPTEVWRWEAPAPASMGMPAADLRGVVASFGHVGLVHLDRTGGLRWEVAIDSLRDVAPLLVGELVVAPTEEGLVAVERVGGQVRWSAPAPDRPNTPVMVAGRLVATTWEGGLFALGADGSAAWSAPLPGPSLGPAAATGDVVVATWDGGASAGAGMVAFDALGGGERWRVDLAGGGVSAPTVVGDVVVAVAGDRAVHAVDAVSGEPRWSAPTPGGAGSPEVPPLALEGGDVLVVDRLGGMALVGGAGAVRWWRGGVGAAVRGGPQGPDAAGRFAVPVDDGRLVLAGPGAAPVVLDPSGRVAGVATLDGGELVVATREAPVNALTVLRAREPPAGRLPVDPAAGRGVAPAGGPGAGRGRVGAR